MGLGACRTFLVVAPHGLSEVHEIGKSSWGFCDWLEDFGVLEISLRLLKRLGDDFRFAVRLNNLSEDF